MISAMNSALQGMQTQRSALAQHADRISRWGTQSSETGTAEPPINIQEEMIGVLQARRGFEANLPVIKAADEMLGSLIDMLA